MCKKNDSNFETLRKSVEVVQDIQNKVAPMVELQESLRQNVAPIVEEIQATKKAAFCEKLKKISEDLATRTSYLDVVTAQIQTLNSVIGNWLQTIEYVPLVSIFEDAQVDRKDNDYKKLNRVYLTAMFDAKWFPYAGWIADIEMANEVLEILDRSKKGKNRVKIIDSLIFSYYNKKNMDEIKRNWRRKNLSACMTRILIQSVQAYYRKEYALTVCALLTLWEGIIYEKTNGNGYRTVGKTQDNLKKLIEENGYDEIFTSFSTEFIYYTCDKIEDVKPDVPGRHGIVHGWYTNYPTRKAALNAILFTDFLLNFKPLEKEEETAHGQNEI